MNLLNETQEYIGLMGQTHSDIIFIGSMISGHCCTWQEFEKLADRDYDNGFGAQEVANDLQILFKDGSRMWRHEYDGAENWHSFDKIKLPENNKPVKNLFTKYWATLEEINES